MNKRLILALVMVLALVGSLVAACAEPAPAPTPAPLPTPSPGDPSEGMEPTIWRYQCCNALGTTDSRAAEVFKAEIEALTNGRLKVEIYPSGGLNIPLTKMVSAVGDGLIEMGECIGGFVHGEFYISDVGQFWGLIPEELEGRTVAVQATRPFFETLLPGNYNQYYLGSLYGNPLNIITNVKVESFDDLKGLKLRVTGPYLSKLVTALGAVPVSIASGGEIYEALSKKLVNGAISGTSTVFNNKFYEVAKYNYYTRTGQTYIYHTVNKDAFDALPLGVQGWVIGAWERAEAEEARVCIENGKKELQALKDLGMETKELIPEDMQTVRELTEPFIEAFIEEGGPLAYEAMKALRDALAEWEAKQK